MKFPRFSTRCTRVNASKTKSLERRKTTSERLTRRYRCNVPRTTRTAADWTYPMRTGWELIESGGNFQLCPQHETPTDFVNQFGRAEVEFRFRCYLKHFFRGRKSLQETRRRNMTSFTWFEVRSTLGRALEQSISTDYRHLSRSLPKNVTGNCKTFQLASIWKWSCTFRWSMQAYSSTFKEIRELAMDTSTTFSSSCRQGDRRGSRSHRTVFNYTSMVNPVSPRCRPDMCNLKLIEQPSKIHWRWRDTNKSMSNRSCELLVSSIR